MLRKSFLAAAISLALATTATAQRPAPETTAPDSITAAVAEFITGNIRQGIDMVMANVADMGLEVDSAAVLELVRQGIGRPVDPEAYRNAARTISETAERLSRIREAAFLDAAAARPGATTDADGLVLETLSQGTGPTVAAADTVVFHYKGVLPGGRVFDDTAGGEPLSTVASGLVPGMTKGLAHMSKGGRYRLTIPSALAYGHRGAGDVIPPDTPLEFTIEIIDIKPHIQ